MNCEITLVEEENYRLFENMIPKKQKEYVLWQDEYVVLGAIVDHTAAGIAVMGIEDNCAQLKWLYVVEEYRKNGIATALLRQLNDGMKKKGIKAAVACYESDLYGYYLDRIFLQQGYEIETMKSYHYRFSIRELLTTPTFIKAVKNYKGSNGETVYLPLDKVPDHVIRSSRIYSEYQSYNYDGRYSAIAVKDNQVVGYLFIRQRTNGDFYVEMLEIFEKNPMHTLRLICASCNFLKESLKSRDIDLDANFEFQNIGNKGLGFAKRVFLVEPNKTIWFHCAKYRGE